MNVDRARRILTEAVSRRVCPGASVEAGNADGPLWAESFGRLTYEDDAAPASSDTLFDLASLTKVIATASITMSLVDRGRLAIDDLVRDWVPAWSRADRAGVSVADLLEHCSGLPAWRELFRECAGRHAFIAEIVRVDLEYQPRTRSVYSDLGFMLLGAVLERAGGAPLDSLFEDAVRPALGNAPSLPLVFRPRGAWRTRAAPTQVDDWRGRLLRGEVDDQNAWALGGVAAHAGLFGTARAVGRFAQVVLTTLAERDAGPVSLASPVTLRRFLQPSRVPGSTRALAWDRMCPTSSCGTRMSAAAFGHTGFTGTSLWIDPTAGLYVVLLSNRVHPKAADQPIQDVRRALHDALMIASQA